MEKSSPLLITITSPGDKIRFYSHLVGINFRVESHTPSSRGFYRLENSLGLVRAQDAKIVPVVPIKKANFEIYVCNKDTGESGWDIEMVSVYGVDNFKEARILLKEYPHFDCVILSNYIVDMDTYEMAEYNIGIKFKKEA